MSASTEARNASTIATAIGIVEAVESLDYARMRALVPADDDEAVRVVRLLARQLVGCIVEVGMSPAEYEAAWAALAGDDLDLDVVFTDEAEA